MSGAKQLALILTLLAAGCGGSRSRWTEGAPVAEQEPKPQDLLAYPADGQTAGVNPPGFSWTPGEKAEQYRLEVRKAGAGSSAILATPSQKSTVYPPYQRLEPGEYEWQVVYLDAGGTPAGVSKTRRFRLPAEAPVLLMPSIAEIKKKLAGTHPRVFLTNDRLNRIRQAVARGTLPSWQQLRTAADAALEEKSYPEPEPYRPGVPSGEEWLRTFTPGKVASAHAARTALMYKITGDARYLEGARRWMMTLAAWDPKGITSHGLKLPGGDVGNDEASMPMLERMSLAWDWAGDKLTPEERAKYLDSMTERGNQVLRTLEKQDFLSHPYNNHSGRALAFLGTAGLAFLGDIPEAEKWLDYVVRAYLTSYPSWGGDDGGWSQGLSYWSFYIYCHANFAEAFREVTGVDLFQKPFFRNTGYFAMYFQPPYSPRGAFADGGYHPPNESGGLLAGTLADMLGDPVLKWYSQKVAEMGEKNETKWREWFTEDVYATLAAGRARRVEPKAPAGLDEARLSADIGWVAMHSALGDPENDVWVLFRSGRFGSYSHSHSDQNTFQINAYRRSLAIDSGYYPSFGTPHHVLYTRQTLAHNGILVNGRGQPAFEWKASGEIEQFEKQGIVTLVRGEAGPAYNIPQPPSVLEQWTKNLKAPVPPMEPKVETFERTLAFVGSKTRPVLVVHDYLKTASPTTFDWLLHALNKMETGAGSILLRDGDARLAVRLIATVPYRISQHTSFPIKPEFAANTAYILGKESFADQWHLSATTGKPAAEVKFLAVMVPYRASEPEPKIEPIDAGTGFRIGDTQIAAWWGEGVTGHIQAGSLSGDGRLILRVTEDGRPRTAIGK
jgi:uncharacterized protein DUF4962/heparinase II/III-like protein